jgi:regulator of protease activity HflC (stomatin/prohibitin superfamily)
MNISPIFTIAGWVLLIILALYVFSVFSLRSQRREAKLSIILIVLLLLGGVALNAVGSGLVFIDQFEAGVVISPFTPGGVRPQPLEPGLHLIIPFVESVERFSTAKQEYTMSGTTSEGAVQGNDAVEARTADGQQVFIDATVRFYADPSKVVQLRRIWQSQDNYIQRFVRPTVRNVIYNSAASYQVEEIYGSKRAALQQSIQEQLIAQFSDQGLVLDALQLRNITFTPEYAQSIEQKQIAQQQAEQAKLLVQKAQQEADQLRAQAQGQADAAVTKAKGDAEALRQIAAALKDNPDLLTYTYIQKLAPNVGLILLPANNGNPFILDLNKLVEQLPTPPATSNTLPLTSTLPITP